MRAGPRWHDLACWSSLEAYRGHFVFTEIPIRSRAGQVLQYALRFGMLACLGRATHERQKNIPGTKAGAGGRECSFIDNFIASMTDDPLIRPYMTIHPTPYIALSTSPLTRYQSALRSANSYTSSAGKIPPYR